MIIFKDGKGGRLEQEFRFDISKRGQSLAYAIDGFLVYNYGENLVITCIKRTDPEQEDLVIKGYAKKGEVSLHQALPPLNLVRAFDFRWLERWDKNIVEVEGFKSWVNKTFIYGNGFKETCIIHSGFKDGKPILDLASPNKHCHNQWIESNFWK